MKIKENKNKKAISLIVLVVTILVLAILAATVIITISNTNVINQANQTTFKSDMVSYKEAYELYITNKLAEDSSFDRTTITTEDLETILGKIEEKYKDGLKVQDGKLVYETEDEMEKEIAKALGMEKTDPTAGVTIPEGFYYVGGTKDAGLVISDDASDANKGVDYICVGNQFVWVPVDDYTKFVRGSANSTTNDMTGILGAFYEPYASGYLTEKEEYDAMCESVAKYKGFYIARFEAGDGDAKKARTALTEAHTVVSKKGVYVYNYVKWGASMEDIGEEGAVYLSQKMYADSKSVVSTLCYGVQWDAVMNFVSDTVSITDSTTWGNYSNSKGAAATNSGYDNLNYTTGRNEAWKAKNIYDLAGNVYEWTMEAKSSGYRIFRGGSYSSDGSSTPASDRVYGNSGRSVGFRPVLYIKVNAETEEPEGETSYSITNNLTNVKSSSSVTSVQPQSSYTATLSAKTGYSLRSVKVTMGEEDITSTSYKSGTIKISQVTGNIVITADANPVVEVAGAPIPAGFYYVGGSSHTGVVISDNEADANKGVDYTCVGNQFVWVPVSNSDNFVRGSAVYNSSTNIYKMTGTLDSGYEEPFKQTYVSEQEEYAEMCKSVKFYRGFYIARFEAGDGDAKVARTALTEAHTVVSKKGAYVYNYVLWGESMTSIGTRGAVYLSQNMYKGSESVVSTLCYGVQWDAIMNFVSDTDHNINDSASWGNYSGSGQPALQTTGYSETWKAKNIYDLAGNVMELTMEVNSSSRVLRGGYFGVSGSSMPAANRVRNKSDWI